MAAFGLMAMACGNLDNPLEDIQGSGSSSAEDVIAKYEFKITDLQAVPTDLTGDVTLLKMAKTDGSAVATVTADAEGKLTIEAEKLEGVTAGDYWFEATTVTAKYIAKASVDPAALDPETPITLAMATIGDVILTDGSFAAPSTTSAKAAMIAYIGDDADGSDATNPNKWHGLAIALADESASFCAWAGTNESAGVSTSTAMIDHKAFLNGIADTETLITKYGDDYAAAKAKNYETTVAAPASTSGWFLPSSGQWLKFFEAAGVDVTNWTAFDYAPAPDGGTQADNWTKINTLLTAAGGPVKTSYYWSSSEGFINSAGAVNFKLGSGVRLRLSNKSPASSYVRSFLAF